MEIDENASEGSQGYRCFLNGIAVWHASSPRMVQPFLAKVVQYRASRDYVLLNIGRMMWGIWDDRSETWDRRRRFEPALYKRPGSHP
eukprot:Skav210589  [mRNA]  locus=scaffold3272:248198:248458:+ [translate_table: standard]